MSSYLTVDGLRDLYSHIEVDHAGLVLKFSLLPPMVVSESLRNRCWDLLRQRQALRDTGRDPNQAHVRSPEIVENYEQ